jgi:hypothetical protein
MPSTHLMHGFVSHRRSATGHASFIGGWMSSGGRHSNAHLLARVSVRICFTEERAPSDKDLPHGVDRRMVFKDYWRSRLRPVHVISSRELDRQIGSLNLSRR